MSNFQYNYLLIGKCRTVSNPTKAGGVIVLFEQLISDFKRTSRQFNIVDLNRRNYPVPVFVLFFVYVKLLLQIPRTNIVFFNGTAEEYKYYSWFVVGYGKLLGKKVVLRKFAGNFDQYYEEKLNPLTRSLINFALKNASINYFETKYLVETFKKFNKRCYWFPNVRVRSAIDISQKKFRNRFVFISSVTEDKGVIEILEAIQTLSEEIVIEIYGPLVNFKCPPELTATFNKVYKGTLTPQQVIPTLEKYDVLLLPTFHKGEGYPGIIIEALAVGMPVIVTPLKGIKEMITDGYTGYFVKSKDSEDLIKQIKRFNNTNYPYFSENAYNAFSNFDNEKVMERVFEEIENL